MHVAHKTSRPENGQQTAHSASDFPFIEKRWLSKNELAAQLGVGVRTLENWMAQRRIPFLRLSGRLVKFNLERVEAALARYEVKEIRN